MPACVDQELLLGGLVDGELDAANTALVEAHVARCAACRCPRACRNGNGCGDLFQILPAGRPSTGGRVRVAERRRRAF